MDEGEKEEGEGEEQRDLFRGAEWSTEGIPCGVGTDAYKSRHLKTGQSACSLSASAREKLPSLDDFITEMDARTGKWPLDRVVLTTFHMVFPREAAKLLVDKVKFSLALVFRGEMKAFSCTRSMKIKSSASPFGDKCASCQVSQGAP